jgi:hypothetical protein
MPKRKNLNADELFDHLFDEAARKLLTGKLEAIPNAVPGEAREVAVQAVTAALLQHAIYVLSRSGYPPAEWRQQLHSVLDSAIDTTMEIAANPTLCAVPFKRTRMQ